MDKLPTTDVSGWVHDQLQGEVVEKGGIELPTDSTPVIINKKFIGELDPSAIDLFSISRNHARSYEVGAGRKAAQLGQLAIWYDQYDNPYTSYSLKGNNFSREQVIGSLTAPSGYIAYGVLESDALLRVVRSSRMMREGGISTEWINRVFEPQEMLYEGERVSQAEFKRRLLGKVAAQNGLRETARIAEAIEPMTFFITGRSMEINDRPADFETDNANSLKARLRHVFRVYNELHRQDPNFHEFDVDNISNVHEYFSEQLPFLIGRSLGKLHNMGLVHSFPVMGNVNALGGLVDLDSIKGKPLGFGEDEITTDQKAMDLFQLTGVDIESSQFINIYRHLIRMGILTSDNFARALEATTESYEAHRQPPLDAAAKLREELYLSLASMDGHNETFKKLDTILEKDEARYIEDTVRKLAFEQLIARMQGTYSGYIVARTIDFTVLDFARKQMLGTAFTQTELIDEVTLRAGKISVEDMIRKNYDDSIKAIDRVLEDERIKRALSAGIPDEKIIRYILDTVITSSDMSIPVTLKTQQPDTYNGINNSIQEFAQLKLKDFIEDYDEAFLKPLVNNYPELRYLGLDSSPFNITVFDMESIFAYNKVPLDDLIDACKKESIGIILSPINIVDSENEQIEQPGTPRALFSDATFLELDYQYDEQFATRLKPTGYNLERTEYLAWLLKNENGEAILLITHQDPESFKASRKDILTGVMANGLPT